MGSPVSTRASNYQLTINDTELTAVERHAIRATDVNDIELEISHRWQANQARPLRRNVSSSG
jgi:hypothetical protein